MSMRQSEKVDVALNIFGKPYQTALSVLSLLRFCDRHIDRFFLQFEPKGMRYDSAPPYAVAAWLGDRAVVTQPELWISDSPADISRLSDPVYRLAIRYQPAFEHSLRRRLFIMHNDVLITKDIIGAMLAVLGDAFAVGSVGQCWNCPASRPDLVRQAGLGETPCSPERYADFRPDFAALLRLYDLAGQNRVKVRPYREGLAARYRENAWPLPECRVNEWGCLIDLEKVRHCTPSYASVPPFGANEACGNACLDTGVAWFRELHRLHPELRARHFALEAYLRHRVGSFRMSRELHLQAEWQARSLLEKSFRPFVSWCREQQNGMFRDAPAP
jgi:hypothetical protein